MTINSLGVPDQVTQAHRYPLEVWPTAFSYPLPALQARDSFLHASCLLRYIEARILGSRTWVPALEKQVLG